MRGTAKHYMGFSFVCSNDFSFKDFFLTKILLTTVRITISGRRDIENQILYNLGLHLKQVSCLNVIFVDRFVKNLAFSYCFCNFWVCWDGMGTEWGGRVTGLDGMGMGMGMGWDGDFAACRGCFAAAAATFVFVRFRFKFLY